MENYSIYMPSYSIGKDVYGKIKEVCNGCGKKVVAIGGHKAIASVKNDIIEAVSGTDLELLDFLWYGGEASYENVELLKNNKTVQQADIIFAIGGGKALDTSKCLGVKINKPVFTFPTIASTCAACTSVAIMYNEDGTFKEPFFFAEPPKHAFIQTGVIAKAPKKYMWAGMGDTYAKHYESTVSARDEEVPHYFGVGTEMSGMCVSPLIRYGKKALEDNENGIASYELEQCVLAIVVTTAMASIFLTTEHTVDYNSGLAHAIFYSLTAFPHIEERHLHGEVVGFGVLILLLCDNNTAEFEKIFNFNKSVGLPTSLNDIEISKEQLEEVLPMVLKMPDIIHNPYVITEGMLIDAFERLEKYEK